jgi:hypothetical protein
VTTRRRRLVLGQSVLSFVFTTTIPGVLDQRRGLVLLTRSDRVQRLRQLRLAARRTTTPLPRRSSEPSTSQRIARGSSVLLGEDARGEASSLSSASTGTTARADDRPVIGSAVTKWTVARSPCSRHRSRAGACADRETPAGAKDGC